MTVNGVFFGVAVIVVIIAFCVGYACGVSDTEERNKGGRK